MAKARPTKQIDYFRKNGEPFAWKLELLNAEYQTAPYSRNDRPNCDMVAYYVENKWSANQFDEDAYPIYNRYVKEMLLWYRYRFEDFNFAVSDLENYDRFKTIIGGFINTFNLNCSLKTAGKFLWTAGKEFFPRYVYKDLVEKYG